MPLGKYVVFSFFFLQSMEVTEIIKMDDILIITIFSRNLGKNNWDSYLSSLQQ